MKSFLVLVGGGRVREFWRASSEMKRRQLGQERREVVLKALVKRFFCEKEVTSTLYMDALFTACKFLFWTTQQHPPLAAPAATKAAKGRKGSAHPSKAPRPPRETKAWGPDTEGAGAGALPERPAEVIALDSRCFRVNGDLLALLERAARDDGTPLLKGTAPQAALRGGRRRWGATRRGATTGSSWSWGSRPSRCLCWLTSSGGHAPPASALPFLYLLVACLSVQGVGSWHGCEAWMLIAWVLAS